jgi:hypothetical protein
MNIGWLAVLPLTLALHCYDLYESDGTWRGVLTLDKGIADVRDYPPGTHAGRLLMITATASV